MDDFHNASAQAGDCSTCFILQWLTGWAGFLRWSHTVSDCSQAYIRCYYKYIYILAFFFWWSYPAALSTVVVRLFRRILLGFLWSNQARTHQNWFLIKEEACHLIGKYRAFNYSALQRPLIHPSTHQWVGAAMQWANQPLLDQSGVKCLALSDGLGWRGFKPQTSLSTNIALDP